MNSQSVDTVVERAVQCITERVPAAVIVDDPGPDFSSGIADVIKATAVGVAFAPTEPVDVGEVSMALEAALSNAKSQHPNSPAIGVAPFKTGDDEIWLALCELPSWPEEWIHAEPTVCPSIEAGIAAIVGDRRQLSDRISAAQPSGRRERRLISTIEAFGRAKERQLQRELKL